MQTLALWIVAGLVWGTGEARRCYHCSDCKDPTTTAINADCSQVTTSQSCYWLEIHSSGKVYQTCGDSKLDDRIPEGCHLAFDAIICRCSTDLCNTFPGDTILPGNKLSTSTPSPDSWTCYWCSDCGNSLGHIISCSGSTKSCYSVEDPNGRVYRTCALENFEKFALDSHCYWLSHGYSVCKCSEKNCNVHQYRQTTSAPTTLAVSSPATNSPANTTPEDEEFYCHSCTNCGDSVGPLKKCQPEVKSCVLIIHNGTVSRSCGTAIAEATVTKPRGCQSSENYEICKCSTTECNSFYTKTGISPILADEYSENVILVASAMKQDNNKAAASSSANRMSTWATFTISGSSLSLMWLSLL